MSAAEPDGMFTKYTYDAAGNRASKEETTPSGSRQETIYKYDASNRLQKEVYRDKIIEYTYDNNGNLLYQETNSTEAAAETRSDPWEPEPGQPVSGAAVFLVIPASAATESAISLPDLAGAVSGCAVTGSAITYRYDNFNRLISYENGSITAQYAYDGEDYRIRKTVSDAAGTKETRYFYEGNQVAYEADASGNLTAHNVYGTTLISRRVDGKNYYYLYNAHGDVVMLIDAMDGSIAATYDYDAFGTLISQTSEADNSIRYAGYQYDLETGLYYVNARDYNSTTGRFITEDTYIGKYYDPLSLNRYTYCHNNPLRYTDPSGHGLFSSLALKFLGGAVFGAVAEVVSQKLFEKKEKIDWKAVAYEAVVGGVSAAVGGVIGKKLASKTTGSATKKIVKSAVAAGVSESSSGFATDVGKQIFVEDKKLDEVDYGQAAKTASIAGIAGIAGVILGAYKECISGYRLETKQRKVKRYSVRYQCFNAIENCPNHPNYPVVTGVREQMETYQEWVYVGKEYADDLADSTKKGITKAAKSTETVKKAAEKKAASTIQDGAAETVTKKESLLDRVKKWWEEIDKDVPDYSTESELKTYYHVTTKEAAKKIKETGQLKSGRFEGHVFAWTQQPTKKQADIAGIGSRNGAVLKFQTKASFVPDEGNTKKIISSIVVQTSDAQRLPISIINIEDVGFKKEWWKFWER